MVVSLPQLRPEATISPTARLAGSPGFMIGNRVRALQSQLLDGHTEGTGESLGCALPWPSASQLPGAKRVCSDVEAAGEGSLAVLAGDPAVEFLAELADSVTHLRRGYRGGGYVANSQPSVDFHSVGGNIATLPVRNVAMREGMRRIDLDPERLQALAQLFADYADLDVDRLRSLVESPTGRRRRAEPVRPRSFGEITAAVEAGWLTKNEARKMAGLTQRRGPQRKPKGAAS
jgi:hypothetical protein